MTDEEQFIQRLLQADRDIERARRIQPGRGHRHQAPRTDWVVLAVVIASILMGWVCSYR